jgi:DNA repair protein RadD
MFELRPNQHGALNALGDYWRAGGGNPLLSLATATGKSLLIAWLIRDLLVRYPNLQILSLVHVQELIEQNVKHLLGLWPEAPLGINCAAFGRRDWDKQVVCFDSIRVSVACAVRSPRSCPH